MNTFLHSSPATMLTCTASTIGMAPQFVGHVPRAPPRLMMTARAVSTPHRPFVDTKQSSINQLDALRQLTTVVADTGELDLLQRYTPQDCTTNPTLVLRALSQPSMQHLLVAQGHADAADRLVVALGAEIVKHIPGRVSSEVDAHLSYDTTATVDKACPSLLCHIRLFLCTGAALARPVQSARRGPLARVHQNCLHVGGHPSLRNSAKAGHSVQHDPAVQPGASRGGCGCGCRPHLAVCGAHSRLAHEKGGARIRRARG